MAVLSKRHPDEIVFIRAHLAPYMLGKHNDPVVVTMPITGTAMCHEAGRDHLVLCARAHDTDSLHAIVGEIESGVDESKTTNLVTCGSLVTRILDFLCDVTDPDEPTETELSIKLTLHVTDNGYIDANGNLGQHTLSLERFPI
jgi:hypothetical protein